MGSGNFRNADFFLFCIKTHIGWCRYTFLHSRADVKKIYIFVHRNCLTTFKESHEHTTDNTTQYEDLSLPCPQWLCPHCSPWQHRPCWTQNAWRRGGSLYESINGVSMMHRACSGGHFPFPCLGHQNGTHQKRRGGRASAWGLIVTVIDATAKPFWSHPPFHWTVFLIDL